ncbi:hypothetical protein [Caballeronia pedi]|uniref:hypothetical protein n=1 Tax=Caballeronia pedi TaxID=1777141 RepID=UPI00142E0962|nr:hypothetical protein [Caballeronia pedi]
MLDAHVVPALPLAALADDDPSARQIDVTVDDVMEGSHAHSDSQKMLRKAYECMKACDLTTRVSFNLSARDIRSAEAVAVIVALIMQSAVAPGRLAFKVTETVLIQNFERAASPLRALEKTGRPHLAGRFRHGLFEPQVRPSLAAG